MKLTYNQLFSVQKSTQALPVKGTSVLVAANNIVRITNQLNVFDAAKNQTAKKYSENPQELNEGHEHWQNYVNDMNGVLAQEVEVEGLKVLKQDDIDSSRLKEDQKSDLVLLMFLGLLE